MPREATCRVFDFPKSETSKESVYSDENLYHMYPRDWRTHEKTSIRFFGGGYPVSVIETDSTLEYPSGKSAVLITYSRSDSTADEERFAGLVETWIKETALEPSLSKRSMNPSYQRIIAMGPKAIPLILKEMQRRPGHWFWALEFLIQDEPNPAEGCEDLKGAREAWLKWGESKGYL